jgi:hypothetical protein
MTTDEDRRASRRVQLITEGLTDRLRAAAGQLPVMTEIELELLRDIGNDCIRFHDDKLWRRLDGDRLEPFSSWGAYHALHRERLVTIDQRRGAVVLTRAGYLALLANAPGSSSPR